MNEDTLQRLLYYKGQLLTAQDFKDQQNYHKQKLAKFIQRFPEGIVNNGLRVTGPTKYKDDKSGIEFDAFFIGEGLAFDRDGNPILVSKGGLANDNAGDEILITPMGLPVKKDGFDEKAPYLSLYYKEIEKCAKQGCETLNKKNRVMETVQVVWLEKPNIPKDSNPTITVAKIAKVKDKEEYVIVEGDSNQSIRLDAAMIGTKQIKDKAVTTEKLADNVEARPKGPAGGDLLGSTYPAPVIKNNAINSAKIAVWDNLLDASSQTGITTDHIRNGAVTTAKLASALEATPKNNSVVSDKIAVWQAGSDPETGVKTAHLQDRAVTSGKIELAEDAHPAKGIQSVNIANGAVTEKKLADHAVTSTKIENAVEGDLTKGIQTVNIANGAVTEKKLADHAVTSTKIENAVEGDLTKGIQTVNIANGAVIEKKLADHAVTSAKIENAVDGDLTKGIQTVNIANKAVTSNKLALARDVTLVSHSTTVVGNPAIFDLTLKESEIIQIKPISKGGPISWDLELKTTNVDGTNVYTITVKNNDTRPSPATVTFQVIQIDIGAVQK